MASRNVPLIVIRRQLGHSTLGITSIYVQGTHNVEIIETVRARRLMIHVSTLHLAALLIPFSTEAALSRVA